MVLVHTVLRSARQMGGGTSVLGTFLIRIITQDILEGGLKEHIHVPVQVSVLQDSATILPVTVIMVNGSS